MVDPNQRAEALDYSAAAGRRALSELAYEEAAALFQLALSMGPLAIPPSGPRCSSISGARATWRAKSARRSRPRASSVAWPTSWTTVSCVPGPPWSSAG
jgi:hypothetical protein